MTSFAKAIIKKFLPYSIKNRIHHFTPTYNEDGICTNHNADFTNDPQFKSAYEAGFSTGSTRGYHARWRVFTACWAAKHGSLLDGDFVECGTNRGMTAKAICNYINFKGLNKRFFLMDTFEGFNYDKLSEKEKLKYGSNYDYYEECFFEVKNTFKNEGDIEFIKGTIPETLSQVETQKVAFLHIDMNCVEPEIAAGEYFWDKLSTGAIILLDDYSYPSFEEQKYAWDRFAKEKGVMVYNPPTGQGIIIKP